MLKNMLGFAKGDRFDPTTGVFPDINVEKLAKDLRLERVGPDRGKNDLPGPEDQGFDSVEHEITSAVGTLRMKGLDHFQQHQQVYAERLGRAAESRVEVETIAGDAEVDFQAEVKIWNDIMANKRNMVSVSGGELQRFYERNRVGGAAQEGSGVYKFIGLATVILVIESLGNGLLFREASTQGLLGGFVIAVSISVLNVGFASLTGLLARNFNHVRWLRKLSALVLAAGFGVLVAAINLAAAHFRDAATSVGEMETAAATALTQFATAPHQLASLQSWLLVGLGFLIAIVAGWKGYCIDDPYPGFGRVWRQMIHARDHSMLGPWSRLSTSLSRPAMTRSDDSARKAKPREAGSKKRSMPWPDRVHCVGASICFSSNAIRRRTTFSQSTGTPIARRGRLELRRISRRVIPSSRLCPKGRMGASRTPQERNRKRSRESFRA